MPKISELTVISEVTANDMMMVTDAETSESRRITWSNVESSISQITGDFTVTGNTTLQGTLTLPDADITFQDNAGTFPTSGKGFYWDLNNDEARIYAIQSASDYIDFVFKVSDNTNNQNDRWVFWLDSYQGTSYDSFPLTMTADYSYFWCNPSGTSGKPDTGDWKFRLDSDGAFRNMAPSSVTPSRNGELVVEATSNTTVKIKLKGSDGTVRSVSLTLS